MKVGRRSIRNGTRSIATGPIYGSILLSRITSGRARACSWAGRQLRESRTVARARGQGKSNSQRMRESPTSCVGRRHAQTEKRGPPCSEEHRTTYPRPPAVQLPELAAVSSPPWGSACPTLCPMGLNRACPWLQVEDGGPDWGIPSGHKKSQPAAPSFTRQAVDIWLSFWFFDHRRRGDRRELTTIRLAGSTTETMGMN
jgi:hypothetical protein